MSRGRLPPVGFWSYARQDDQLSKGKLSSLRVNLIEELQQQFGREEIRLFQDATTIAHGAAWEREIRKAIGQSSFFVPIVTPNFIQSEWCCREVALFAERQAALREAHPDLPDDSRIFPILFIDIEDVEPEEPAILAILQGLQWFDFRRLRHRSYDDPAVKEELSELATSMRRVLRQKVELGEGEGGGEVTTDPSALVSMPPAGAENSTLSPSGERAGRGAEASEPLVKSEVATAANPSPSPSPEGEGDKVSEPAHTTAPPRAIAVGDVLNSIFEVKRLIKAGGMGQVFEGAIAATGERVAIKALLPHLAADARVIALFNREAMVLTRLKHDAICQYKVLAQEPALGVLYIVMEYIDGVDLSDALATLDRSPSEVTGLLRRLAAGLAAAHKVGAVHRDLSLDNVMLPGGDVHAAKIIDFGIAKQIGGEASTVVGKSFAGKLGFAAPEQLGEHGGEVGSWTDVYSLGLVMLAVATGDKPDMGGSFVDAVRKRQSVPTLDGAPDAMRPLLAAMLAPVPAQRLQTMDDVLAMLDGMGSAAAEVSAPPPAAAVEPTEAPTAIVEPAEMSGLTEASGLADFGAAVAPQRKSRTPLVIGGLVVAALIALGVWAVAPNPTPVPPPPPPIVKDDKPIDEDDGPAISVPDLDGMWEFEWSQGEIVTRGRMALRGDAAVVVLDIIAGPENYAAEQNCTVNSAGPIRIDCATVRHNLPPPTTYNGDRFVMQAAGADLLQGSVADQAGQPVPLEMRRVAR